MMKLISSQEIIHRHHLMMQSTNTVYQLVILLSVIPITFSSMIQLGKYQGGS